MIYPQNWTFFCNFQVKVRLNFELVCKTFLHKRKIKVNYMLVIIESINNKKLILDAAYSIWLRSDLWSTPTNLMSLHIENWGADGSSNFNFKGCSLSSPIYELHVHICFCISHNLLKYFFKKCIFTHSDHRTWLFAFLPASFRFTFVIAHNGNTSEFISGCCRLVISWSRWHL